MLYRFRMLLLLALLACSEATMLLRDPATWKSINRLESSKGSSSQYKWTEEWLEAVPVDHFSFANKDSFKLRLVNFAFSKTFPLLSKLKIEINKNSAIFRIAAFQIFHQYGQLSERWSDILLHRQRGQVGKLRREYGLFGISCKLCALIGSHPATLKRSALFVELSFQFKHFRA